MKKIGFITTNKVLAQSLSSAMNARPELELKAFILSDSSQALLDVEVLKIDVAVLDVTSGVNTDASPTLSLCKKLRQAAPACRLLLLLSQNDRAGKKTVVAAVHASIADDFVFYDTSLEYLFAKLSAF